MGGPHVTDALLLRAPSPGSPAGGDQCVDGKDRPEGGWGGTHCFLLRGAESWCEATSQGSEDGHPAGRSPAVRPGGGGHVPGAEGFGAHPRRPRGNFVLQPRPRWWSSVFPRSLAHPRLCPPPADDGPWACVLGPPGPSRRGGSDRAPTATGLARDEAGAGGQAPESGGGNGNAENSCRNRRERQ